MEHNVFKMYHPKAEVEAAKTRGQCWRGDTLEDGIEVCRYQTIDRIFEKYLPRKGKILESGCGLGRWVFYLRKKGYDVTGIDLVEQAVQTARAYDPEAPVFVDDVLHSRFPDDLFAAVISLGVIEHFEEGPEEALAEIKRVLSNDGLLFLSVPTQNLFRLLLINHLKRIKMHLRKLAGHEYLFEEYRYTRGQMTRILVDAGFEIIEMVPDDYFPPKSMGLYVDLPFLRHKKNRWEMNLVGKLLDRFFRSISPWLSCSSTLWVCKHSK